MDRVSHSTREEGDDRRSQLCQNLHTSGRPRQIRGELLCIYAHKKWWQNRWVVINDKKKGEMLSYQTWMQSMKSLELRAFISFFRTNRRLFKSKKKKKVMKGAPSKKWNYIISIFLSLQVTVSPLFLIKFSTNSRFSFLSSLLFRFSQTRSLPCC